MCDVNETGAWHHTTPHVPSPRLSKGLLGHSLKLYAAVEYGINETRPRLGQIPGEVF